MALDERYAGGANGGTERDSRLKRLYREAARETPPAHLDAAILAAARREAGARPRSLPSTLRRWHVPVSIAAVVIVSVSLVILVREEGGDQELQAPPSTVTTPAEQPAIPGTPQKLAEAVREAIQPGAAAPAPPSRESLNDGKAPAALRKLTGDARPESGPPAVSGTGAVAAPEPAAKPVPQPFLAAPRAAEERGAPSRADGVTAGRVAGAPAAPSEPLAVPFATDAPPRAKLMERPMAARSPEQDRLRVWHGFEQEPPQKWLEKIEELKRQGRAAEAEEMLSEFKRRFPEHPLPLGSK